MLKKYLCSLPDGRESQQAIVLGRNVTLTNNRIYNESVITKVYPSYFKLIKEEEESRIIPEVSIKRTYTNNIFISKYYASSKIYFY